MRSRPRTARSALAVLLASLVAFLCALASCSMPTDDVAGDDGGGIPPPTTGPFLGLTPNPPDAVMDSARSAEATARATGGTLIVHQELWSWVEQPGGALQWTRPDALLGRYRHDGWATFLELSLIDAGIRRTPWDLTALAWDDPVLVQRTDRMVDSLAWLLRRHRPVGVSLGREVDRYFATHEAEFPAFLALYRRAVGRLHAAAPGIPVGIGTTCPADNPLARFGDSLAVTSDLAVHTLYPTVPGTMRMETPAVFAARLEATLARRGPRRLALTEVGYATAAALGASPDSQAACARCFRTWFAARTEPELLLANWHSFTDEPSGPTSWLWGHHGPLTAEQQAFYGSRGLRDSLGVPKPGWAGWRGLP
jgi:hypothetical protein